MLFLRTILLPWLEKFFSIRVCAWFEHLKCVNVEVANGRNNVHDARVHLRRAICSLALAKLNGEPIDRIHEFEEEMSIFETLFNDRDFGKRAGMSHRQQQMHARFVKIADQLPATLMI